MSCEARPGEPCLHPERNADGVRRMGASTRPRRTALRESVSSAVYSMISAAYLIATGRRRVTAIGVEVGLGRGQRLLLVGR
jgi:hypothetical protein